MFRRPLAEEDGGVTGTSTLAELAELVGGKVVGDPDLSITGFNGIEHAGPGELTFLLDARRKELLETCRAAACVVPADLKTDALPLIQVENPDLAAARIHRHLLARPFQATGIHPSAVIGRDCHLADEISIGPQVSVGDRVRIGQHVVVHPGAVIGDDVVIGDETCLHANVTVCHGCRIGRRVVLHPGVVIGAAGFGFATDADGRHVGKPQVGIVVIEDDVEIGANSCVDRAAFGETRIGRGSRIDDLVMVAHNVQVGENCILVAQTGIAGSTRLGRNVVLGAKAGIAGHLDLGDGVMVAAKGGVHNSQPPGSVVGGTPAIDIRKWGRAAAAYGRLPDMMREMRRLRRELNQLREQLAGEGKAGPDQSGT